KVWFCSGSRTSSKAEDGSPRKSEPILSPSSSRNSGFEVLALRIDWMTLPGIEPEPARVELGALGAHQLAGRAALRHQQAPRRLRRPPDAALLISLDRCQALIIRSNSRICSLSFRS